MQHLNTSPGHENTLMERVTMLARHLTPGTQEWITRKGLFLFFLRLHQLWIS